MQTEDNRNRMWTFIFLYILGLNICQATGKDNSTQMYYAKLTIDESAIRNITEILKTFVSNATLQVDDLKITTSCQNVSAGTECTCEPNYRWSDKVCKSYQKCCGNEKCTFPQNSAHMCVSNTIVAIKGSIILTESGYYSCLADESTDIFKQCNDALLKKIKYVYSTLRGFDTLNINKYSAGSVIADFEMIIANNVRPTDLIEKSKLLSITLSASLELVTTGVVRLSMPTNPVCYNCQCNLECTSQEDLGTVPAWQLKSNGRVYDITNGTESTVTFAAKETKVALTNTNEVWAGEYICVYRQTSQLYNISHKASAVMDICLLPNIYKTVAPEFPHCKNGSDSLNVRATCEIESSNESYTVTWKSNTISPIPFSSSDKTVHAAQIFVSCNSSTPKPQLTCTFKNRCNQSRTASIDINIIYENEPFCAAEGEWKDTKAGFTAVLKCKDAAGQRKRECKEPATWGPESSSCVNQELISVLKSAIMVDNGLGSLNGNAADVFSRLLVVTNNTETINTFANMNASVEVLFSLSQKSKLKPNESAFNDILKSSSNLLDKSLEKSWVTGIDKSNLSLAEKYLNAVEQLINLTNITVIPTQTNVEVASSNCSKESKCTNTVFNVTVDLDSQDPGSVKTTGFKELHKYFPKNDDEYNPNSLIMSTVTEREELESVKIKIKFPLLKPRPRNVEIKCVSWDNTTRTWSSDGCIWEGASGPSNEGLCVCSHLSSFAILMSKYPLEISGLNEITYAGLSISVMSLIITLIIEMIVWSAVVRTNSLYLRHTAHVNISICLLVADCCFLASSKPGDISEIWCKTFAVLKHFCYLSMFFWMLCLSSTLLHQAVFLFHNVSKKTYLRFSLVLGYVCPLLIVAITFLANGGDKGLYFSSDTCWLVYSGLLTGSIHTFLIPVGIIVFVNIFSMLVVIMKLLDHPKNTDKSYEKEKKAAVTVMRSVILLTPIFGVTWIFGFAVMLLDLTSGNIAFAVNYAFTLLNAFQGLFILLTTSLGDKLTREALLNRLKLTAPASTNDSSTNLDSTLKK